MSRFRRAGPIAIMAFTMAVGFAHAEEIKQKPKGAYSFFNIEGGHLVIGKHVKIDAAYGAKEIIEVKAPFSFTAPTGKDFLIGKQPTPGSDTLIKIAYATLDKEFIENFQFSTLTVPPGPEEARLNTVAKLLANQAFGMAVRPYKEPKRDGVRKIEIGKYAAVEVFGRYIDPDKGVMYLRIVGIPHPERVHGVFMVANIVSALLPLDSPDQLATRTRSGAALKIFKYLD